MRVVLSQEKPPQHPWASAQLAPSVLGPTQPSPPPDGELGDGFAGVTDAGLGLLESISKGMIC